MKKLSTIEFNKVTWYSKLAALLFFIIVMPVWMFYVGVQYEKTILSLRESKKLEVLDYTPTSHPSSIYVFGTSDKCKEIAGELDGYVEVSAPFTCQFIISKKLPAITFAFEESKVTINNVTKKTQSITVGPEVGYNTLVALQDINFDGYNDLLIRNGIGTLDNTPSTYWLYNVVRDSFEPYPPLSDISNPEFDPHAKTITSTSRCCAGLSYSTKTYSFINNAYILTEDFSHEYDPADENSAIETRRKLIDGTMTVVSEERVQTHFQEPTK